MARSIILVVTLFSACSFLFYGFLCLFSKKMVIEFERYRLSRFRRVVGLLEFGGGLGQILGIYSKKLALFSSGGLAFLMLLGIWTRKRINDPWYLWLPAFILFLINIFLFFENGSVHFQY